MSDSRNYSRKRTRIEFRAERQSRVIFFLMSALAAIVLTLVLRDESFSQTQDSVLFLMFFAIGLWITEAIPPFAVGILIVGFLVFTMGREETMDASQYVQTWSDSVIWLFLGGFFLAEGLKKTRLDYKLLSFALPKFGSRAQNVMLGLMLTTAVMSMLMSNTATTAMMLATVSPLLTQLGKNAPLTKVLLIGIPSAAAIGGMGTIIGSAPNAIAVGALEGIGIEISFIEWMVIGIPIALVLIVLLWKVLLHKYKITTETLQMEFLSVQTPIDDEYRIEDKIRRRITLIILSITLLFWLTSQWTGIPVAAVSGIPIVGLTMFGIIDADDVRSLPWDTLMLVAGGLALGLAIKEQGLAQYFVDNIKGMTVNYYLMLIMFAFVTVMLSNVMSNTAATTILIPIAISLMAISAGANPTVFPVVIGLCASCALLLPVSTPPNAIAYSTGLIDQKDFRTGGILIGVCGPILIILWTLLVTAF
ncbi:MAG: DASS family sodium-coupled anion symporter [Flavobacterium sp.]|nr:DASS family sodium-coupled anion symporter [Flavobacterium sp.]